MAIRFHLDEHVHGAVAAGLRARGVHVTTTAEAGMRGASDEGQLAFATTEGRAIVSQDADFLRLHARGVAHAGIVYVPANMSVGDMIRGLMVIHQVLEPQEMRGHVEFL